MIIFNSGNVKELGRLTFDNGQLSFTGNVEDAEIFFNIIFKFNKRTAELEAENDEWIQKWTDERNENQRLLEAIGELQAFAIWLTGCGYNFAQHEYYMENKDVMTRSWSSLQENK